MEVIYYFEVIRKEHKIIVNIKLDPYTTGKMCFIHIKLFIFISYVGSKR